MKIVLALFPGIFGLPRIFRNSNANGNLMQNFGVRQPNTARSVGMTNSAMRMYFRQQKLRGASAAARRRTRLDQILNRYFQRRDALAG